MDKIELLRTNVNGWNTYRHEHPDWTPGLRGADLSGADLSGADLSGADLSEANLSEANLSEANLSGAYLSRAYLRGADLSGADLRGADLSEADLREADLRGANLSGAYLSGANLSGANLSGAYLSGANLSGANLSGAIITKALTLPPEARAYTVSGPTSYPTVGFVGNDQLLAVSAGCWTGDPAEFLRLVKERRSAKVHTRYSAAVSYLESCALPVGGEGG